LRAPGLRCGRARLSIPGMRIEGEHAFSTPRERVWEALNDPRTLARALPGAQRLDPVGADEYALTVSAGVGAVRGTYEGTFALADKRAGEGCVVRASVSGGPGSVATEAHMTLRDADGGGAVMSYEAEATVTGALAGVGQRLVAAAARRSTRDFLEALEREIAAPAAEPEAARAPAAPPPPRRAGADPVVIALSALGGCLIALAGVAVGRWSARR
jgi:carbon monoxide dehydrogenase subunit G